MKTKYTQKPVSLFVVLAAFILLLAGSSAVQAQQVLSNAFYGPFSSAPNTAPGFDYVANGIIGDTNWDGVYLNGGDIPFGTNFNAATREASGAARTLAANTLNANLIPPVNSGVAATEALQISQTAGSEAGQSDSGFFLWKGVSGDFDMAVRSEFFRISGNLFTGLMVRPWNTNNTGAPVDFNRTTGSENFLALLRNQNFGSFNQTNPAILPSGGFSSITGEDEIRISTNGVSTEEAFPDARNTNVVATPQESTAFNQAGTNETRMFRIVRHQLTNFTFYIATNLGDPWTLITNAGAASASRGYTPATGTIVRPDWTNALFQAGIEYSTYAGASGATYFDSFQIAGTNLNLPNTTFATPATNLVLVSTNTNGSATLSWTPGTNLDGSTANSLVIVRQDGQIITTPISGTALPLADSNLLDVRASANQNNAQYGASNNVVVYEGSGNSVTVSGLLNGTHTYQVAVLSYSNISTNLVSLTTNAVFNTAIGGTPSVASTSTNSFVGPGALIGITATILPSSIPVNGAATATVIGTFTTGDTQNLTLLPGITLSSSDPAITAASGVLSANAVTSGNTGPGGTGNIVLGYGGFLTTNNVTAHLPVFTDNFSTPHSYLTNGVLGTPWDGVYETNGDFAGQVLGSGPLVMTTFDADITSNNCLTISSANGYWKGNDDNGPFLYKVVLGDFQSAVHITGYGPAAGGGGVNPIVPANQVAYEFNGLMARAFAATNDASPFGTGRTEDFVNWMRFDQFTDTTVLFQTVNGGVTEFDDQDGDGADWWILLTRVNSTNFYLFKGPSFGGPWTLVHQVVQPALVAGTPVQVGLEQASYGSGVGTVNFDTFMLDGTNIVGAGLTPAVVPTPATGISVVTGSGFNTMTVNWTAGTIPGGGVPTSFVVVRAGGSVASSQPYFGETTTANSVFGLGTDLGGGNFVVFRGGGAGVNSVIVTGLIPGIQYYATVYQYASSGATKAFNEAGSVDGESAPVTFTGVTANVSSTARGGIPVYGIGGSYQVLASIQGSPALIDVSASSTLIQTNGIVTGANGIFTGLSNGTDTNVTFSFLPGGASVPFVTPGVSVTVRRPTYSDNFGEGINYLALAQGGPGATAGTIWDGILLGGTGAPAGYSIPGGNLGAGIVTALDAGITTPNVLTLVHASDTWAGTGVNDGFLLYKNVVGDFQASVFVTNMTPFDVDDQMSGLMVRAATYTGAASSGQAGVENFMSDNEFQNFALLDVGRYEINGADNQPTTPMNFDPPGTGLSNGFLVVRSQGTNLNWYHRNGPSNPWIGPIANLNIHLANLLSSQLVEVGPDSACYGSTPATTGFSQFMLDLTTGPVLTVVASGGNLTISWDASDSFNHLYSSPIVPGQFTIVSGATITTVNGVSSTTVPIGAGDLYYEVGP